MIKLSVTLERDPEHESTWVATCPELGVVSAAACLPDNAVTALAQAISTIVSHAVRMRVITTEQAFAALAAEARCSSSAPEPDTRDSLIEALQAQVLRQNEQYRETHKALCERNSEINDYRNQQTALLKALGAEPTAAQVRDEIRLLHADVKRWLDDGQHADRASLRAAECRIGKVLELAEGRTTPPIPR